MATANATEKEYKPLGIWLEVAEVRLQTGPAEAPSADACCVQLKADKEQPKPIWWSVDDAAWRGGGGNTAFDIYKAILNEFDKKRVVLVWLSPSTTPAEGLRCRALRFQSPELGGR